MKPRSVLAASAIGVALASSHGSLPVPATALAAPHGSWGRFLAAIRAQESHSDWGHDTPGCLGAYCWNAQVNWDSMATAAGLGGYAGADPASLPPSVQNQVASVNLRRVYRQTGSLLEAAAWWNGGSTSSVPNPALPAQPWAPQCGGGTSYAYACQVLVRMSNGHGNPA